MIVLNEIAKRYEHNWIFRNVSCTFEAGKSYALVGNNGSGKSTLLRCIASMHTINKGTITYSHQDSIIAPDKFYKHYSFSAPGMEIIDEMTLSEFLKFHFQLKNINPKFTISDIIDLIDLRKNQHTYIRNFSSGMKQRVKLAQALFSDVPYIFLDEPCTNLDQIGFQLYQSLIDLTKGKKTLIIASNDEREYSFANEIIDLHQFKDT